MYTVARLSQNGIYIFFLCKNLLFFDIIGYIYTITVIVGNKLCKLTMFTYIPL